MLCAPCVFQPNKHVYMNSSPFMKFKAVEKSFDIRIVSNFVVAKDMFTPFLTCATTQVPPHNLF